MKDSAGLKTVPTSALLRITVLPADAADPTRIDLDLADTAASERYLRELTADPLVREAIAVSSSSLDHTLEALTAGRPVDPKKVRRAVLAVSRYLLRMATRPTPFGLMAGVARARFGPAAEVRLGTDHGKGVRVDAGWLAELVRRRQREPDVLRGLRVVLNNLCAVRGDRLVLSYVPLPEDDAERPLRELSVRHTPVVAEVVRLARRPIGFADLVDRLAAAIPAATPDKLEPVLVQLIERQLLLTELAPPPSAPDPIAHVLARLPDEPSPIEVGARIEAYAGQPVGAGLEAWRVAAGAGQRPPHVDLRFDAGVTVPATVAAEVERAVAVLARLTPDRTPSQLRQYHLDFLERYGDSQLVGLPELLDPGRGMDAPAGYQVPRSTRELEPDQDDPTERDRLLAALAQQAVLDGSDEVVLDDATVDRLAVDGAHRTVVSELDLAVEIVADSPAALDAGDFRVVVGAMLFAPSAGAVGGRFGYLLGDPEPGPPDPPGAVTAQLEFQPARARAANIARVPRLSGHLLTAGLYADPDDPAVIGVDEVLVGADRHRLYLWSDRLNAEIIPAVPHMLNTHRLAPNVVRFLAELAMTRQRAWRPWQWGRAGELLAFLPRVRSGRAILSPAAWRPDPALADQARSDRHWRESFEAWRTRFRLPSQVYLTVADNRVGLDLDAPLHRSLLRHELGRSPGAVLVEPPAGGGFGAGWLSGHAHELVVSLRSSPPAAVSGVPAPSAARIRHYPGGEWVYAKLYAPQDRHQHLIAHSLEVLRAALPESVDRWYFVRYRDPEPHLRIRVHGDPGELVGTVLPLVHDWAATLCEADLAQRLVLDTYEPELSRYGGPGALEAAERAFHADTLAVLAQLRLVPVTELLVAAGFADLAAAYGEPAWQDWFVETYPKVNTDHQAFQQVRADALAMIADGVVDPRLTEIWERRAVAVRAYGARVRELHPAGLPGGRTPLGSLLHMNHNRLVGVAPDAERRAYAVVGGVLRAVRARKERPR